MTRRFLRFLRGNAIAMLALFIALTGTTYAASTGLIGKNTVASPQVVNGSLQTKDLSGKARAALKGAARRIHAHYHLGWGLEYMAFRESDKARREFWQSIRNNPLELRAYLGYTRSLLR